MRQRTIKDTLCNIYVSMHVAWIVYYYILLLENVVISKKFLRTRKIMVMHSNERGECVHVPS